MLTLGERGCGEHWTKARAGPGCPDPSVPLLQFLVDCSSVPEMPTLYFAIGGAWLPLPPAVYVLQVGGVSPSQREFPLLPRRKSEFLPNAPSHGDSSARLWPWGGKWLGNGAGIGSFCPRTMAFAPWGWRAPTCPPPAASPSGSSGISSSGSIIPSSTWPTTEWALPWQRRGAEHHPRGILSLGTPSAPWDRGVVMSCE